MKLHLLDKDELELKNYQGKAGMIDIMTCGCGATFIYVFADSGKTPGRIGCTACGGNNCFTSSGTTRQPDRVWFRPATIEEVEEIAEAAYDSLKGTDEEAKKEHILVTYVTHYNEGGLFAREVRL